MDFRETFKLRLWLSCTFHTFLYNAQKALMLSLITCSDHLPQSGSPRNKPAGCDFWGRDSPLRHVPPLPYLPTDSSLSIFLITLRVFNLDLHLGEHTNRE